MLKLNLQYQWTLTEFEPVFDAADMCRVGKDVFIQHGLVTNNSGIEWLRRELADLVRIHECHFPHDKLPIHIDATLVPLRPPKGLYGTEGLVLYNPEKPPTEAEATLWQVVLTNTFLQILPVSVNLVEYKLWNNKINAIKVP